MGCLKLSFAITAMAFAVPVQASDLTLDLKGVRAASGDLYIGLQKQDEFMKDGGSYGTVVTAPQAGDHQIVIKDVAPGYYHIGIWHDIDGDNKFSVGEDFIPTDGWSSFKAETLRAAPTWDQVKYAVTPNAATVSLTMVYHP